jgi:hypothetical protein
MALLLVTLSQEKPKLNEKLHSRFFANVTVNQDNQVILRDVNEMPQKPNIKPTIFLDIDGTLVEFTENFPDLIRGIYPENWDGYPLPGSVDKCFEWHKKGFTVILVTGRPMCLREFTELQLQKAGVIYDMLIMGVGNGPRVLINDADEGLSAFALTIKRDKGIGSVDLSEVMKVDATDL